MRSYGRMAGGRFGGPSFPQQPGATGAVSGPIPPGNGGNAVQGKGIVFTYATPLLGSLAGSNTVSTPQVIQFDANSVFVWQRSTFTAALAGAAGPPPTGHAFTASSQPIPNILVSIQDTGKGATFMNTPVPVHQVAGMEPGFPYILPTPQLIQANASFAWTFTNYDDTDTYYAIQFQLHGFRIFNPNITDISQLFAG